MPSRLDILYVQERTLEPVSARMARENDGSLSFALLVWTLYLLAIFALADFAIILTLFAHHGSDATMSSSLVLIFASSILSTIYISLHIYLAYRFRQAYRKRHKRTYVESISRFLPRLLVVSWIAASANGLVVAARQPRCLPSAASHDLWRAGLSCSLHRSATGIAVGALVLSCVLFCSIEVCDRPSHASPTCVYRRRQNSSFGLTPSSSDTTCCLSPESSLDSHESEKAGRGSRTLSRQLSDREFWLQRQNSLSSRNAIYPPCVGKLPGYVGSAQSSTHSVFTPQVGRPRHWPRTPSHCSVRSTSMSNYTLTSVPLPSVSEYESSISSFPRRAPSSLSSSSSSSSPLSTMRRASQPDVPIIPNRFTSASSSRSNNSSGSSRTSSQLQRRSSLPYAWSPLLHHAPLSADPAIRALSTHSAGGESSGDSKGQKISPLEPAVTVSNRLLFVRSSARPQLPRRAAGHGLVVGDLIIAPDVA